MNKKQLNNIWRGLQNVMHITPRPNIDIYIVPNDRSAIYVYDECGDFNLKEFFYYEFLAKTDSNDNVFAEFLQRNNLFLFYINNLDLFKYER